MALFNALAAYGAWNWLFLAVVLLGLETIIPGVHFVWFGCAAMAVGALGLLTGLPVAWQLVAFAALSVGFVFAARKYARSSAAKTDLPELNERAAQYIGRIVTVEVPISGGRGKVRVGDTVWQAEGADTQAGARVRIKSANGPVLVVEPA